MPQTKAVAPFKGPIDETKIQISWLSHVDEWGNRFPDGETYSLTYPEVYIPEEAYGFIKRTEGSIGKPSSPISSAN